MSIKDKHLLYISTSEKIRNEIAKLSPGARVIPLRKLSKKYNVSYVTAQKAVKILQSEGVLKARKGKGIFVGVQNDEKPKKNKSSSDNFTSGTKNIAIILPCWIHDQGKTAIYSIMSGFIGICQKVRWTTETIFKVSDDLTWKECGAICDKEYDGLYWPSPSPNDIVSIVQFQNKGIEVVTSGRGFPQIGLEPIISNINGICIKLVEYSVKKDKANFILLGGTNKDSIIVDSISQEFVNDFYSALECEKLNSSKLLVENVLLPGGSESLLTEIALKKNPDVNSIACLSERVFPAIEKLLDEGFWDTNNLPLIFNCVGDYGFNPECIGPIKLVTIRRPYENIGKVAAYKLIEHWLGDQVPDLDLDIELIIPK